MGFKAVIQQPFKFFIQQPFKFFIQCPLIIVSEVFSGQEELNKKNLMGIILHEQEYANSHSYCCKTITN
jgi:hypothetical protein